MEDNIPLEYNIFKLSFTQLGAIEYFDKNLPAEDVRLASGKMGIYEMYLSILDFYRNTSVDPIDTIAFTSWLETETDLYVALGGAMVVATFLETVMSAEPSTVEAVTNTLRYRANAHRQLQSIEELKLLVSKKEVKTKDDVNKLSELTDQIRSLSSSIQYNPYDHVEDGHTVALRADSMWDLPDFLPTQFKELNKAIAYNENTGGFVKGSVNSIIAQSGKGKSTLARCFMKHWLDNGHSVLYVNYEEAKSHWERILYTQITGRNVYKPATPAEKAYFNSVYVKSLETWGKRFMVRHDPDTPYFEDLERWIYDLIGFNDKVPDAIIIDTIQSMFVKSGGNKPRWGQFEEIMVRLEKIAKDTNAVTIITSQENSNRMKEKRDVVQQSDAGGSLTIIQKSTIALFITQKKLVSGDDSESDHVMELQIPKNRITGDVFSQRPPLVIYDDETKSYLPFEPTITSMVPDTMEAFQLLI